MYSHITKLLDTCKQVSNNVKMSNKNRQRFLKLTNNRVNAAINQIRLVGNLSDKRYYDYSEEEAKSIINTLKKELKKTENRFSSQKLKKNKEFDIGSFEK